MSKLIRIIRGVYGYKKGLTTIPKTSKDKPFEVDDVTAQRLIRQGVAEIATEKVSEAEPIVKYSVNLARQEERIINKKDEKVAEETAETAETDAQNEDAEGSQPSFDSDGVVE